MCSVPVVFCFGFVLTNAKTEAVRPRRNFECDFKNIGRRFAFKYVKILNLPPPKLRELILFEELLDPETITGLVILHAEKWETFLTVVNRATS